MTPLRIVLDSNVLVSGLRSRRGASFQLLNLVGSGRLTTGVSVPLVVEYEHALLDAAHRLPYGAGEIRRCIDYLCTASERQRIHFLWRPLLPDANDDMVLEAAVAGRCRHIVTFNVRDFDGTERFGIHALPPTEFLQILGEKR
jgi:predicted nucleic acid-binding protein